MKKESPVTAKIKVAHVAHAVGGVDVYLRLIIGNLNSEKFENIVVHGKTDTSRPFLNSSGNAVQEYRTNIIRKISPFHDFKSFLETYSILKKEQPDVIHAHSAKGGILGKFAGLLLQTKVFYTPHAFSFLSAQNKLKRRVFLSIEKLLSNRGSIVVATSASEKQRAIEEAGYLPKNAILFNNCINPVDEILPLSIEKTWPDQYICTVGRPSYQKNIELMVRIMSEVKKDRDIHLVIMGVGHHAEQLEAVKKLIGALGMSLNITLLNWTDRNDVLHIISKSKFYISTARYEGMPYSIIESLSLSKACVVTDCDGNKDLIQNGYNGFVIKNDNIAEFKNAIVKLLDDKPLLDEFCRNSHRAFSEKYNIRKNISELESIYAQYAQ